MTTNYYPPPLLVTQKQFFGVRSSLLPVKLCALVDVDDAVAGGLAVPDGIVQEPFDPVQDDLG